MKPLRANHLIALLLRSYGQLFLCNSAMAGALFLLALGLISPVNTALSLVAATIVTLGAHQFCRRTALVRTGLFGVNGVLYGFLWILAPEVSPWIALAVTIAGSAALLIILIPLTAALQRRTSPFTVFSLPAVLIFWLSLCALAATGHTDLKIYHGWRSFFAHDYETAQARFSDAKVKTNRATAYQCDGQGWTAFRQRDYASAAGLFERAIAADPTIGDPWDGAGWTAFKRNDWATAVAHFNRSLALNRFKGSSWDGLGWSYYMQGDIHQALTAFKTATRVAPLFDDPHLGIAMCRERMGAAAQSRRKHHERLSVLRGSSLALASTFQLLGWLLFLVGIISHSRISAVATLLAMALATVLPGATDVNLFFNLAALIIALAGAYLVMSPTVIVMLFPLGALFIVTWPQWDSLPLPVTCLPFNLFLLGVLVVCHQFKGRLGIETVPLEIAVTKPETVIWWRRKRDLVRESLRFCTSGSTTLLTPRNRRSSGTGADTDWSPSPKIR